jgi:hypothetical protein
LWQPLWSLRANLELARLMAGGLRGVDRRWDATDMVPGPSDEKGGYRRPTGGRRLLVRATKLMTGPVVSLLERRGHGDRLVVEAEPGDRR